MVRLRQDTLMFCKHKNKKTSNNPVMYYIKSGQGLPPLSKS